MSALARPPRGMSPTDPTMKRPLSPFSQALGEQLDDPPGKAAKCAVEAGADYATVAGDYQSSEYATNFTYNDAPGDAAPTADAARSAECADAVCSPECAPKAAPGADYAVLAVDHPPPPHYEDSYNWMVEMCDTLGRQTVVDEFILFLQGFPDLFTGNVSIDTKGLYEGMEKKFTEGSRFLSNMNISVISIIDAQKDTSGAKGRAKLRCKIMVMLNLAHLMGWFYSAEDQVSVLWDQGVVDAFIGALALKKPDVLGDIHTNLGRGSNATEHKEAIKNVSMIFEKFKVRRWDLQCKPVQHQSLPLTPSLFDFATKQRKIEWKWPQRI